MNKILTSALLLLVLTSCSHSVIAKNEIIVGSLREGVLFNCSEMYAVDEFGTKISVSLPFSYAYSPRWSPDGQWITYQTEDTAKDTDPQVYIVKADGSEKITLTNDAYPSGRDPTWSPDGNQIAAYFCAANGKDGIYIIDMSCIANKQGCVPDYHFVTEHGGLMLTWSADGKQLAYWSRDEVFVVSMVSPEDIKMISPKDMKCFDLDWSPINNEIAMRCYVPQQGNNIFLVNSDGSNFRNITNSKSDSFLPTWSPDGTKIAFTSDRDTDISKITGRGDYTIVPNAVYIMNSDGTDVKRISPYDNERIFWIDWVNP